MLKNIRSKKYLQSFLLLALTVVTSTAVYFNDVNPSSFMASLFGFPEHAPFDGTVLPIKKVPDYVHLGAEKKNLPYSSLDSSSLIDIPKYEPNKFSTDTNGMSWSDANANALRNAKITYSVPYMGNYKFDGVEGGGSHAAVDIKVPVGTPIFAIANGTVIKTKKINSGFGYHIVVQHNNVPSFNNENVKETYYSSYSHLSGILVEKGDVVVKGQQIALSGRTGTATTPHLHFQIDNDEAPWHPFWPFDWQESNEAGLNFFEAINAGLGRDKGYATTVNPMMYVQKYFNESSAIVTNNEAEGVTASSYVDVVTEKEPIIEEVAVVVEEPVVEEPIVEEPIVEEPVVEIVAVEEPIVEEPVVETPVKADPVLTVDFEILDSYYASQGGKFVIKLRDQYGELWGRTISEVIVSSYRGNFTLDSAIITSRELDSDLEYEGGFNNMLEGRDKLKVEIGNEVFYSDNFDIVDTASEVSFPDVSKGSKYYEAVVYLVNKGVVSGYPDGTFKPAKTVSRVEALKFILEGVKVSLKGGSLPFSDVSGDGWYSKYLYTAYKKKIVDGYKDGTFKPNKQVNKAEFYKILLAGMGVNVEPITDASTFDDVSANDWYAPYVVYAKSVGVIDANVRKMEASKGMSRGEVAYAIYNLMKVMK